ncbi:MAG: dihydrolipoyllysine-residue acetyltransferase [Acidiferrobacterales bacterium]
MAANAKDVLVPDIGDFKDVDVIEVLVAAGERVSAEDPLITLESDKATMDVPSPHTGVVRELKLKVGDKVSQGSSILTLELATETTTVAPGAGIASTTEATASQAAATTAHTEHEEPAAPPTPASAGQMVDVRVPDIGDFKDVDVIEVLVAAGERVSAEDPLITLESDKATMDVPSPYAGVIDELKVKVGDKVSEGSLIVTMQMSEAAAAAGAAAEVQQPAQVQVAATAPPAAVSAAMPPPAQRASPTATMAEIDEAAFRKAHASPTVRRFARELGVDISKVKGTGPKERVLKEDVQGYVKTQLARPETAAAGFALPEMPQIDFSKFGEVELQPLSRIKKISGPNLQRSWVVVPHVTQHDEADITELEAFRQELKEDAKERGIRLTPLAFLMKASVTALKKYPSFNASLDTSGESLIVKKYYHIGVAVDTPDGLVVPVIRDVDHKGIFDLAAELGDVSVRTRDKKLTPTDLQGGCFTISSLGGIGGTAFTPIVNAPEVAILGVSRSRMQPVYHNGEFVARLILPLSLSYDHRVIDGAQAARFTSFLSLVLTDVRRLLL